MIKVYAEVQRKCSPAWSRSGQIVALFDDEDLYLACLPAIEKHVRETTDREYDIFITESMDSDTRSISEVTD